MSIGVTCPGCGFAFKVADRQAGRKGKCPKCKGDVVAPSPLEATGPQASGAFDDFFIDAFSLMQPLPLDPAELVPCPDLAAAKAAVVDARETMSALRDESRELLARWNMLQVRGVKAEAAATLLKAGCRIKPEDYELATNSAADAQSVVDTTRTALGRVFEGLRPFEEAAARRLALLLQMLLCPPVKNRVAGGPQRADGIEKPFALAAFIGGRVVSELRELLAVQQVFARLFLAVKESKKPSEALLEGTFETFLKSQRRIESLRAVLGRAPRGILLDESGEVLLERHALPIHPGREDFMETLELGQHAQDALTDLYRHALGRLCVAAEEVEKVLGLPPLARAV